MIINTVMQCQESHYVSIVATSVGMNKIGKKMRPSKGSNFFRTVLSIPNLEKVNQLFVSLTFKKLLKSFVCENSCHRSRVYVR